VTTPESAVNWMALDQKAMELLEERWRLLCEQHIR
jgi:hypothetical protein